MVLALQNDLTTLAPDNPTPKSYYDIKKLNYSHVPKLKIVLLVFNCSKFIFNRPEPSLSYLGTLNAPHSSSISNKKKKKNTLR